MAKVLCVLALIALVQSGYALNCYSCDANSCQQEESKWLKVENCGKTVNTQLNIGACLKQVYTDKVTNKDVTVRRCIIATKDTNGKPNYSCQENAGKTSVCDVCSSDYCNSASSVSFSFVTVLGVVAAYLIPRYM